MKAGGKLPLIKGAGLNVAFFQRIGGTPVQTEAGKFVIPVGNLADPEAPVVPAGAPNAGNAITDWEGNAVKPGVVFFNGSDPSWVCACNNSGVIISNEVTQEQAEYMLEAYHQYVGTENTSLERLKTYLYGPHKVGGVDTYESNRSFIANNFKPIGDGTLAFRQLEQNFGWMHRERNPVPAVFINDAFVLERAGAEPITYTAGALLLAQPDEDFASAVQPDIAARTYSVAETGLPISDLAKDVLAMSAAEFIAKTEA